MTVVARTIGVAVLVGVLSGVVLVACSSEFAGCEATRSCPASSGGGSGGEGGEGGGGGSSDGGESGAGGGGGPECELGDIEVGCDPTEDAIHVAPSGNDGAAGTRGAPVATLSRAVELAAGERPVLVCNATYDEHVLVEDGASIYGGFSCSDWSGEDGVPLFKPSDSGAALRIDGVDDEIVIENVSFEVPDATEAGGSSVTAIVNAAPSVSLRNVSLKAGEGLAGADGTLTEFEYAAQATLNGNPENPVTMGGGEKICECQNELQSSGGLGGTPSTTGDDGADGSPDHGGGQGGDEASNSCGAGSSGQNGSDAPDQSPADGARAYGMALPTSWQPTSGEDGATGEPGQGGGGGASLNSSGHGGGGGCGGCGGNGGKGGQGGGGSIALLLIDSPITLEGCTLVTSDAGDGGDGAAGQPGQQDQGAGGGVVSNLNSCPGGVGGKGGDGGAGGGGAGGISVGIVWQGEVAPSVSDDTSIMLGEPGLAGEGGAGTNDGIDGVSLQTVELAE